MCPEIRGSPVRSSNPDLPTFYLRYKDQTGKTCHQKIGRVCDVSLLDARKAARQLKAAIRLGENPRGDAKARKAVITWNAYFDEHYLPYVKPRKRSWKRDEQLHRLWIRDVIGDHRLDQITKHQVQRLHTGLLDKGLSPASADHVAKLIRQALNLAVEFSLLESNPIAKFALFRVDNRVEHYLDEEQLARLVHVLRTDSSRGVCQIMLFLLSTGARLNEALQATWTQIDRRNRVWRIPAAHSKSKKMRSVPLNDSALEVLDEAGTEGKFEHVFINHRAKGDDGTMGQPYRAVHKVWDRLRAKAGLPKFRAHDMRHQFASFLVNSGRTLYEVQQVLGHSDPKVTERYAHLSSRSLQEAANSASVAIRGTAMAVPAVVPTAGAEPLTDSVRKGKLIAIRRRAA